MLTILAAVFGLTVAVSAPESVSVPVDLWTPVAGDRMIVDTLQNVGYLVHGTGEYTSFPVITGRREIVRYIGRTYDATTPVANWTVKSTKTFGDRVTFGDTGFFLRLYKDGKFETSYGIHGYKYFDEKLAEGIRFFSFGCVLVSDDMLAIIKKTYETNGKILEVATVYGGLENIDQSPTVAKAL